MKLLFAGDFNVTAGSGYATILENICSELVDLGHEITVLGYGWDRSVHYYDFQVIPSDYGWLPMQVTRVNEAMHFDHVILAMDIPKVAQLLNHKRGKRDVHWPTASALFAVESRPILQEWRDELKGLHRRFVISRFAQEVLREHEDSLDSVFVPMTARIPEAPADKMEARAALKKHVKWGDADLLDGDGKAILTVADNQERKDLPVIAEAVHYLRQEHGASVTWMLVTRMRVPYGWRLSDLFCMTAIPDTVVVFQELTRQELSLAYRAADLFVIASQAEGACLPVYEALAHDLPVVAPDHTALHEVVSVAGFPVPPTWYTIHPWGTVERWHTEHENLADVIMEAQHPGDNSLVDFIKARTWKDAAQRIQEAL